jgi:uncharacterized Zn finger protein
MSSKKLPTITEVKIRKLATSKVFERGEDCYENDAIIDPVLQGVTLRAECEGSEYEPYQVSVTLNEKGIDDLHCNCPYDYEGICKHLVALLLTYVHEPKSFRVIPPLKEMLADRSKEELVAIINEMIEREPKLISIVELAATTQKAKEEKKIDVSAYHRQAKRAMRSESAHLIERELIALCKTAERFAKAGDYLNAGAIYHASLEEAVYGYDDMVLSMDEDGDIAVIVDDLAEGLIGCLKKGNADIKTRQAWLNVLLDGELKDLELGGVDFVSCARDALLKETNDEEWKAIERHVRGLIPASREWEREHLVGFLVDGMERRKRKDDAKALVREMGTEEQNIYLLIEERKIDEAVKRIHNILTTKPGTLTYFADALVQAKAKDEALKLVIEQKQDWKTKEWLAKYFRAHGTKEEALEAQKGFFLDSPSVEKFKALRETANKLNKWEPVRLEVLNKIEKDKKIGPLIEIALFEKDVARALELLPDVRDSWQDYKWEVASAAQKTFRKRLLKSM